MSADGGDEIIISPRYPLKYDNNLSCVWSISVADDEYAHIKISFEYELSIFQLFFQINVFGLKANNKKLRTLL